MPEWKATLDPACMTIIGEHAATGGLPTSVRFIFYELVQRGIIPKTLPGKRQPSTYVSEALTRLRESGAIPWSWIVDESRAYDQWEYAPSVAGYVKQAVPRARIDVWDGQPPPLVLVESRSLAGVLRAMLADYLVPLASTNGQVGGFLRTDIGPALVDGQRVIYLGDHDLQGHQIEGNTRAVLARYADLDWERLALTDVQVREYALPSVTKVDRRYRPPRSHEAWETEALTQSVIVRLVRDRLNALLPEPLADVQAREAQQQEAGRGGPRQPRQRRWRRERWRRWRRVSGAAVTRHTRPKKRRVSPCRPHTAVCRYPQHPSPSPTPQMGRHGMRPRHTGGTPHRENDNSTRRHPLVAESPPVDLGNLGFPLGGWFCGFSGVFLVGSGSEWRWFRV